jgi:hypothetical protein
MSIKEWVMTIQLATDENSPFKGMIDLSGIFKEPIDKQQEIFDLLSDKTKENLQILYG